jgi:hypothetical protein
VKAAARNRAEVDALVDKLDGEGNGFITMDDIIAVHSLLAPTTHARQTCACNVQHAASAAPHTTEIIADQSVSSPYSMHARHTTYNRHDISTPPTH